MRSNFASEEEKNRIREKFKAEFGNDPKLNEGLEKILSEDLESQIMTTYAVAIVQAVKQETLGNLDKDIANDIVTLAFTMITNHARMRVYDGIIEATREMSAESQKDGSAILGLIALLGIRRMNRLMDDSNKFENLLEVLREAIIKEIKAKKNAATAEA